MDTNIQFQKRTQSVLFWFGCAACVYEAVINSLVTSGVSLPVWLPAIGVGLSTLLFYCNGNNPSMSNRY